MYESGTQMRTSTYYNYSYIADPNGAAVVTPIFNVLHHDNSMATYKIDILLQMASGYGQSASYVVGTISKEGQTDVECGSSGLRKGDYSTSMDVVSTSGNGYLDITPTFAWVEDSHNCNATVLNFTMSSLDMVATHPFSVYTKVTVTSRDSGNVWPELNWTSILVGEE